MILATSDILCPTFLFTYIVLLYISQCQAMSQHCYRLTVSIMHVSADCHEVIVHTEVPY
jgi:hypothetical protein